MADFYIDHDNTTLYTTPLMAAPVWGQPQDGDGTATGTGTTPACPIGSVVFSAPSGAPTAGSVSILGSAAIVPAYSAVADTQANNLATAINASTAIVTLTTKAGNIASPYVKALVYARGPSGGAPAGTCEIMSRLATDAFNTGTNITVTAWNNMTATPSDMRGGVSGPWRLFANPATLAANVSAAIGGVCTYGGVVATLLGTVAAGDQIHVRTKRAGADVVYQWGTVSSTITTRAVGTAAAPLAIVYDNGVKWPEAGVFTQKLDGSTSANRSLLMSSAAGVRQLWLGTRLSRTTCNSRIEVQNVPVIANYAFFLGGVSSGGSGALEIDGLEISGTGGAPINNTNAAYSYVILAAHANSAAARETPGLRLRNVVTKSKSRSFLNGSGNTSQYSYIQAVDCLFDHTGITTACDEAIVTRTVAGNLRLDATRCEWLGFTATANQSGFQKYATNILTVRLLDCAFDNIKLSGGTANGGLVGSNEDTAVPLVDLTRSITVSSSLGIRPFVFENSRRSFAWIDSAAPTSSAVLPDGVTPFSVRTAVTTEVGNVSPMTPVSFPRMAKHSALVSGTRIATLRILVDNLIKTALGERAPNSREMWIEVGYVGTDGLAKSVSTRQRLIENAVALAAGTPAHWSATAYDVNGGSHSYTAYEISVSCPDVLTNSELGLVFCQGCQTTSADNLVFLDPEWQLV